MLKLGHHGLGAAHRASSLVLVTVLLKGSLHLLESTLLLFTVLEGLAGGPQTTHKDNVLVKVLGTALHVLLHLVNVSVDLLVDALGDVAEMISQIRQLLLHFGLERITQLLSISAQQSLVGVLKNVL